MGLLVKELVAPKNMETTQTTQYTATNATTQITAATVTNNTAGNLTFSANLVPSGGSVATSNRLIFDRQVAAGKSYHCPELLHVMAAGQFLSTIASATGLTLKVSGVEITA